MGKGSEVSDGFERFELEIVSLSITAVGRCGITLMRIGKDGLGFRRANIAPMPGFEADALDIVVRE